MALSGHSFSWAIIPIKEIQLSEELVKQAQREMLTYVTQKEAEAYMFGREPIRMSVDEGVTEMTLRASMEISLREFLMRNGRSMEEFIVKELAGHLANDMRLRIMTDLAPIIERKLIDTIKDEVKQQVKAAVTNRLDEFLEEALS